MRPRNAFACLSLGGFVLVWACSSASTGATGPTSDAGDDAADGTTVDSPIMPPPDSSTGSPCKLFDGTDPVALCIEKVALRGQLSGAYLNGHGVAPSWDAANGIPGTGHSWRDDVSFASSIASYHCSSAVYGDSDLTPQLDAVMPDLAHTIVAELPAAPGGYDGEDYFRLRNAVAGLQYVGDTTDAPLITQLADTFGRNLQTGYAQTVMWTTGGGGGDGGTDAGGDAGGDASDAGSVQMRTSTLLGTLDGQGHVVYAPAQVIMGAAALLDMARLYGGDANAATWVATALSSLDYVWARGRDATTGLFYQQLVTSGDPGHDALGQGAPTPDALLTDVQAGAVLGLARAQDLASSLQALDAGADGSVGAPPPYWGQATTIVQALATTGMFDGTITPPAPHTPGAFMEAFIPATAAMDQNKTTLGNAWLLGGFHRVASGMVSQLSDVVLGQLRAALIQQKPANSSLYSVVTNASGSGSIQTAYLRASSKDFHYALLFSPDGGTGSQEPAATSYRSDAVAAMVEGFTQLWIGRASPPQCSP